MGPKFFDAISHGVTAQHDGAGQGSISCHQSLNSNSQNIAAAMSSPTRQIFKMLPDRISASDEHRTASVSDDARLVMPTKLCDSYSNTDHNGKDFGTTVTMSCSQASTVDAATVKTCTLADTVDVAVVKCGADISTESAQHQTPPGGQKVQVPQSVSLLKPGMTVCLCIVEHFASPCYYHFCLS